jgi:hypothetical protein
MRSARWMVKGLGFLLVLAAMSSSARATSVAPEIDPGMMSSALALLGGDCS